MEIYNGHQFITILVSLPGYKPDKDLESPISYPLVALLSLISKFFECLLLRKLQTQPLIILTDQLCFYTNNKETTVSIFLDIEKAFDKVWHEDLVHKVYQFRIPIQPIKIIDTFLHKKSFKIRIENVLSPK